MLPYRELAFAFLTKKVGDALIFTMRPVSDQSVDPFIGHLVIIAEWIGTKVIMGADLLFPAAFAFDLTIGHMSCLWGRYALLVFPFVAVRAIFFCFYF